MAPDPVDRGLGYRADNLVFNPSDAKFTDEVIKEWLAG
jgi:hypothetical protein